MGVPKKRTSKMRRDRRRAANNNLRAAVQVISCPNCKEPTRVRHTVLDDGRRVRVCSHCGKAIEVTA